MKSKSIIPRIQKPQFLITAHTNIKTKDLYEFSQVSRRIKNYFNKSFPHRKDPYSLLIVNETYPDGAFEKCFHLHIILGDFSTELYKSSKLVKDFSKSYPIPNSLDGIIRHQQLFFNEFFNSMKYQRQSLIEEKQKSNFYGLTNTSKAINIVPIRVSQSEALYEYLEKEAPDLDIDLLDAMNSLFTTR